MALDISPHSHEEVALHKKLYIKYNFNIITNIYRKYRRKINTSNNQFNGEPEINFERILDKKDEFHKNNFCFVNNIIGSDYHEFLKTSFPKDFLFNAPQSYYKLYNTGFKYNKNIKSTYKNSVDSNVNLVNQWYNFLKSSILKKTFSSFYNSDVQIQEGIFTSAYSDSYVPLHIDNAEKIEPYGFNVLFYISSSEEKNNGGLILSTSNNYEDKYFEVKNTNNSAIFYKLGYNIYHGFKPMSKNSYRKMISAVFK